MESSDNISKIWCDEDNHRRFEDFVDFNEWLDSDMGAAIRISASVDGLAQPSKAFFAGDRQAYDAAFKIYQMERRYEHLCKAAIDELTTDEHWFVRNETRFEQLVSRLETGYIVPFIGAGLSQPGGFPTWKDHSRSQGRTAGLDAQKIGESLALGNYEQIIADIETSRGRDVFIQEIRDAFSKNGEIPDTIYMIAELFQDTVITTNYDRLIEQAFDVGDDKEVQIVTPANISEAPEAEKTTIIKLHGDIRIPGGCILSQSAYDLAYGAEGIDVELPIPQALDYYYRNSSLLFLGCSLNQDRTVDVFRAIKATTDPVDLPQHFAIEQCPEGEEAIRERNSYLLALGITPIWFEAGRFECIEGILRLARNELRYRRR